MIHGGRAAEIRILFSCFCFLIILFASMPAIAAENADIVQLADAAFEDGSYQLAFDYYNQVLESEPDSTRILDRMGYISFISGRYEEAIKYYDQILNKNPESTRALYMMAMSLESNGNEQEAKDFYQKALYSLSTDENETAPEPDYAALTFFYLEGKISDFDGNSNNAIVSYNRSL